MNATMEIHIAEPFSVVMETNLPMFPSSRDDFASSMTLLII
jgi:hypothetical protein